MIPCPVGNEKHLDISQFRKSVKGNLLIYLLFPAVIVENNNASTDHSIPEILGGSYFWRSINHIDGEVTDPIGIHLRQKLSGNHPLHDIDAGDRTEGLDDFLVIEE